MPNHEYAGMDSRRWTRAWSFATPRFCVALEVKWSPYYEYDGDDPEGETQAKLNSGDYIAFDSRVVVELDGKEIAADHLGGSVYAEGSESEFWTAHRDADPMNRNCSIMRAARGGNVSICHYFPDMVRNAISEARKAVHAMQPLPRLRGEKAAGASPLEIAAKRCHAGDRESWIGLLWEVVHEWEDTATPGVVDDVKTAMAWISEDLGINPGVADEQTETPESNNG